MIDGATKGKLNIKLEALPGVTAKDLEDAIQASIIPHIDCLKIDADKNDIKPDGSIDVDILQVPYSINNDEPDRYGQHKSQYSDKENGYYIKPEVIPKKEV